MFKRFEPAPKHAETFPLSEFTAIRPAGLSRYLPERHRPPVTTLNCPACREGQRLSEHGEHAGCASCDLRWVVFGNTLNIWRDEGPHLVAVPDTEASFHVSGGMPVKPKTAEALAGMIDRAKVQIAALTPAEREKMLASQRESFARGMSTRCEHGILDFEQCPECRAFARTPADDAGWAPPDEANRPEGYRCLVVMEIEWARDITGHLSWARPDEYWPSVICEGAPGVCEFLPLRAAGKGEG